MRRVLKWCGFGWSGLMVAWLVAGFASVEDCPPADEACETGAAIGVSLAVGFIGFVWVVGMVVIGVLWLMSKPPRQPGPF